MTDEQLTPKQEVEAFGRKSDAVMGKLVDAVQAFQDGKISQTELTDASREAGKIMRDLKQQVRDERGKA